MQSQIHVKDAVKHTIHHVPFENANIVMDGYKEVFCRAPVLGTCQAVLPYD